MFPLQKLLSQNKYRPDPERHQHQTAAIRLLFGLVFLFALAGLIGLIALNPAWAGNSPIWGGLFFGIILVSIYASWLLRKSYGVGNSVDAAAIRRPAEVATNPPPITPLAAASAPEIQQDQVAAAIGPAAGGGGESRQKVVQLAKYRETKGVIRPLRLLLVDDNRVNLKVMQALFEKSGYSVLVAERGLPAIEMLDKHEEEIDAAIIDLHMPDLPGDQVVMRWRLLEKRHMPICILTADGREKSQQASINAGADIFMAKPLSVVKMTEWLNSVATAKGLLAPRLEFKSAGASD